MQQDGNIAKSKEQRGFLREPTGKLSMMRLSFFLLTIAIVYNLFAVGTYVLIKAFSNVEITKWTEMGIFLGGAATIVTGIAWQKVMQKKTETI